MKAAAVRLGVDRTGGCRFDAGYHLSDGMRTRASIARSPLGTIDIDKVTQAVFNWTRGRRLYVSDKRRGTPFLGGSTMLKADLSGIKLISNKFTPDLAAALLHSGWILVSCSGTIGNTVYATHVMEGMAASQHVMRIVPNQNIQSGILYAFLKSKYGYALLTQGTYGSVIDELSPEYIKSLQIPVFPDDLQKRVHRLVSTSARMREEADAARCKAIDYFAHYDVEKQPTRFAKRLSQIGFSFAAYNNNLDVDAIRSKYADDSVTIGELAKRIFLPPLFKHIYLDHDNGHPFFTGREITFQNQRPYRWLSPLGVKNIDDYTVEKGTLLIYKSGVIDGGMYGEVRIADDELAGASLSNHVARITPRSFAEACWLYAFLKSPAGFKLLKSLAIGTAIPEMTPKHIAALRIPRPNRDLGKIEQLVSEYISKRVKSNNLENEAIDLVESEIARWQEAVS